MKCLMLCNILRKNLKLIELRNLILKSILMSLQLKKGSESVHIDSVKEEGKQGVQKNRDSALRGEGES